VGDVASKLQSFGKGGPVGVAIAVAVALVGLGAAALYAAFAMTKYAFASADAARTPTREKKENTTRPSGLPKDSMEVPCQMAFWPDLSL
jgi:hypothetical protein